MLNKDVTTMLTIVNGEEPIRSQLYTKKLLVTEGC